MSDIPVMTSSFPPGEDNRGRLLRDLKAMRDRGEIILREEADGTVYVRTPNGAPALVWSTPVLEWSAGLPWREPKEMK